MTMTLSTRDGILAVPREEFVHDRFDYKAGEHVVFGGPTQNGKTTLAFELLGEVATPSLPVYVAVSKPTDGATERAARRLGLRRVSAWPPQKTVQEMFDGPPRGYVVWPAFGDIDRDTPRAAALTRKLLAERYSASARAKKGKPRPQGIMMMDDTMIKGQVLGLDREMTQYLAMSGAMGLGIWVFVQKPTDAGRTARWAFNQSEHVFITRDPDEQARKRYDEIGGIDPRVVSSAVKNLRKYEFLYIRRTGPQVCIVEAD